MTRRHFSIQPHKPQRTRRRIIVVDKYGEATVYGDLDLCADAVNLERSGIVKHIKNGTTDSYGRTYDYAIDEEENTRL